MKNDFGILDELRNVMNKESYSVHTERAYASWTRRYLEFHMFSGRNDLKNAEANIEEFLTDLTLRKKVSRSTQTQAKNALSFLYLNVLGFALGQVDYGFRPAEKIKKTVVLSGKQVSEILTLLQGDSQLVTKLLYGCGLEIRETVRLRVGNIDFDKERITVFDSNWIKHKDVPLPISLSGSLRNQIARVKLIHRKDCLDGHGEVDLPESAVGEGPSSSNEFDWQYLFPTRKTYISSQNGGRLRQHIDPSLINKAIRSAAKIAGIKKVITPKTFRRSFASHLIAKGLDIKTIQELLGHADPVSTRNFTKGMRRSRRKYLSPLDSLL